MSKKKINAIEKYVMEQTPGLQEREHIQRVVIYAKYIARKRGMKKPKIIQTAALLHDMGRTPKGIEFKNRNKIRGHGAVGAAMAYDYLIANGWKMKAVEKVCNCIRAHSSGGGMIPKTIEEKILYDADKLDILGAFGTARIIGYHHDGDGAGLLEEYGRAMKKIPKTLYTKEARQLAEQKMKTMKQYYNALKKEEKILQKIKEKST